MKGVVWFLFLQAQVKVDILLEHLHDTVCYGRMSIL